MIDVQTPSLTVDGGRAAGSQLARLSGEARPTAVFCANDLVALGPLQSLTQHGLHDPTDVAIIGYDDIEYAAAAAIPLSSIRQPREQLGRTAARLLLDELAEGASHQHGQVVFQPQLVARASSQAVRYGHRGGLLRPQRRHESLPGGTSRRTARSPTGRPQPAWMARHSR